MILTLLNKVDLLSAEEGAEASLLELERNLPNAVKISLTRGDSLQPVWQGLEQLKLGLR